MMRSGSSAASEPAGMAPCVQFCLRLKGAATAASDVSTCRMQRFDNTYRHQLEPHVRLKQRSFDVVLS